MHHASFSQYVLEMSSIAEYGDSFLIPKISTYTLFILTGKDTGPENLICPPCPGCVGSERPQDEPRPLSTNHTLVQGPLRQDVFARLQAGVVSAQLCPLPPDRGSEHPGDLIQTTVQGIQPQAPEWGLEMA